MYFNVDIILRDSQFISVPAMPTHVSVSLSLDDLNHFQVAYKCAYKKINIYTKFLAQLHGCHISIKQFLMLYNNCVLHIATTSWWFFVI